MNIGGGEAADQVVRMMLSTGEVAVRLTGSAAKNMLALTMALAKDHKKLSGKVNMAKMLRETRDLRLFPMTPEQYRSFKRKAGKQKLLYSAIMDQDGRGKLVDVVMPVTELDRANLIFERILYAPQQAQEAHRQAEQSPAPDQRQAAQKTPQREPVGKEQDSPTVEPSSAPPKKDTRSEQDLPGTRASSSTSKGGKARMTNERPSVEMRLKQHQAQLQSKKQSAPARTKNRSMDKGAK